MFNAVDFLIAASDVLSFRLCIDGDWSHSRNWQEALKKVRQLEKVNYCKYVVVNFDIYNFEENTISAILISK